VATRRALPWSRVGKLGHNASMNRILVGYLLGVASPLLVGGILLAAGSIDMSATHEAGSMERRLGTTALERSVSRRAPKDTKAPVPTTELLAKGLAHYRENCVVCHGAPGVDKGEIGIGLNPAAPALEQAKTQGRSDGELYWIVAKGIRMTGMPAFASTHEDSELWSLVTFLRHLPSLTADERKALAQKAEAGDHHHEAEHEPEHAHEAAPAKPAAPAAPTKKPAHEHAPGTPRHHH
jgi:mono/diheme cytochrome c family protein